MADEQPERFTITLQLREHEGDATEGRGPYWSAQCHEYDIACSGHSVFDAASQVGRLLHLRPIIAQRTGMPAWDVPPPPPEAIDSLAAGAAQQAWMARVHEDERIARLVDLIDAGEEVHGWAEGWDSLWEEEDEEMFARLRLALDAAKLARRRAAKTMPMAPAGIANLIAVLEEHHREAEPAECPHAHDGERDFLDALTWLKTIAATHHK